MINLKILISDFYNILNTKQTFFELLLNLTFVLILLIIAVIFYWDNINRSIINTSRCKIIMNNEDNIFNLYAYKSDKSAKLFDISYDNTSGTNINMLLPSKEKVKSTGFEVIKFNQYKRNKK
jgi:uncharacterized membrane protein